jgi:hypothetical protein
MFVALHWEAFQPALLNMSATTVLVITPYMAGQKPLHELAQRLVMRGLDHKVKMIRHQRNGKQLNWVPSFR